MSDYETDDTLCESEEESVELEEECMESIRKVALLGHEKDANGRRKGVYCRYGETGEGLNIELLC